VKRLLQYAIALGLALLTARGIAQVAVSSLWAGSGVTNNLKGLESKKFILNGTVLDYPSADAAIFSSSATGGATAPGITNIMLQPDTSTAVNNTILMPLCGVVSLSTANQTITINVSYYSSYGSQVGLKQNTSTSCPAIVSGTGTLTSHESVCGANDAPPCTPASPDYMGEATATCATGAGNCPPGGQVAYSYSRGLTTMQTITVILNSGTGPGTVTPGSVGGHVGP
jgi:hypothetical protein